MGGRLAGGLAGGFGAGVEGRLWGLRSGSPASHKAGVYGCFAPDLPAGPKRPNRSPTTAPFKPRHAPCQRHPKPRSNPAVPGQTPPLPQRPPPKPLTAPGRGAGQARGRRHRAAAGPIPVQGGGHRRAQGACAPAPSRRAAAATVLAPLARSGACGRCADVRAPRRAAPARARGLCVAPPPVVLLAARAAPGRLAGEGAAIGRGLPRAACAAARQLKGGTALRSNNPYTPTPCLEKISDGARKR